MPENQDSPQLELLEIEQDPFIAGVERVVLHTNAGIIDCRYHPAPVGTAAVIWVGGAVGGLDGPAHGLYPRLAAILSPEGIASLRLDYRHANHLHACVLDTLTGVTFLLEKECQKIALVGHSFGGAVVITAGANSSGVTGVATLSSQTAGTSLAPKLSPRHLLCIHGTSDEVLPDTCSQDIYRRAMQPKDLILYPGCGHGLDQCQERLDLDLSAWLRKVLL